MSFHTITIMVRWVVTADQKTRELFRELRTIPFNERHKDARLIELVQGLHKKISWGTKIERLGSLGWDEYESCKLLAEMLENLPKLLAEYEQMVKIHGKPPEWDDKDLEKFERAIVEERKSM